MLRTRLKCLLTTSFAALLSAPVFANDDKFDADIEASAGFFADSNVNSAELDQNTDRGDIAAIFGVKLNGEAKPSKRLTLRGGYEFSQTAYQDFSDFNLQSHRGSAEAEYDFSAVKAGVLYNFVHARLGGNGFLDYQLVSPYISRLFGKRFFLRGAYVFTDKNFLTDNARDTTGHAGQVDAYFFLDGLKRYIILGGDVGGEDALDDQFDLNSLGVKARIVQRVGVFDGEAKLRAGLKYDRKDYTDITTSIGEEREDDIFAADADLALPIYGPASVSFGYEYRDRSSNLPAADFNEHIGEVKLVISY